MTHQCSCLDEIIGTELVASFKVGPVDLAPYLGSGDLMVLGTPRVIAWMEQVTVQLLERTQLPECTSVGTHIDVRHRVASLENDPVDISVRVEEIDGTRISFSASAMSAGRVLAEGNIARAHVNRDKFLDRIRSL